MQHSHNQPLSLLLIFWYFLHVLLWLGEDICLKKVTLCLFHFHAMFEANGSTFYGDLLTWSPPNRLNTACSVRQHNAEDSGGGIHKSNLWALLLDDSPCCLEIVKYFTIMWLNHTRHINKALHHTWPIQFSNTLFPLSLFLLSDANGMPLHLLCIHSGHLFDILEYELIICENIIRSNVTIVRPTLTYTCKHRYYCKIYE